MCRRPKRKCLESYIQLNNWYFPNTQRQLWIIPHYDLGLFTKNNNNFSIYFNPSFIFQNPLRWTLEVLHVQLKRKKGMSSSDILFCCLKKKTNERVHRNSKCPHKKKLFHVHTVRTKTKTKPSLQQLILCPLMLKLRKSRVNIREVNSQIHKEISKCPMVLLVRGADQSPWLEEGAGAVRKQSPVSLL